MRYHIVQMRVWYRNNKGDFHTKIMIKVDTMLNYSWNAASSDRRRRDHWLLAGIVFAVLNSLFVSLLRADEPVSQDGPQVMTVAGRNVQTVIDEAPPHSVVICNRNRVLTLSKPITISKPLTLRGLNARLPAKLGKTPLVIVESENVTISGFILRGNAGTVDRKDRSALIEVRAGRFRIEDGEFHDSTKDGVMINPGGTKPRKITGGVAQNLIGYNIDRDVVSISCADAGKLPVEHVLVENIRCHGSPLRGAVEVSNGSNHITVRKVYAEDCVYAIDIQDHNRPGEINRNIVVDGVHAKNCQFAVRFAVHPFGHHDITLENITAEKCALALRMQNTDRLAVSNIRVIGFEGDCPLTVNNCDGVILRDIFLKDARPRLAAILLENCNDMLVDGVILQGDPGGMQAVVKYLVSADETFSGLDVRGILASGFAGPKMVSEYPAGIKPSSKGYEKKKKNGQ